MVKISGFTDEVSLDLSSQIALLKELDMKYMCPRNINGKNIADYTYEQFIEQVKPELDKNGIKFSSIGSPIGKTALYNEDAYIEQLKKLENLIKIAEAMECKYIRIFSFFIDRRDNHTAYSADVIKKLKGFIKKVEGTDIILLHENEKLIYGDVPERAIELYEAINHPNFKLCYDASNYVQCKVDPYEAYLKTRDYTVYYHMKDCLDGVEVPLGIGQGRIEDVLRDLVAREYDGFLTMEPHTGKYALLKKAFYICPLLSYAVKNSYRVYKYIDETMKVNSFQKVSRKDVFLWQYAQLTAIMEKVGMVKE